MYKLKQFKLISYLVFATLSINCYSSTFLGKINLTVAAGSYADNRKSYPLLAISQNEGINWSYPREVSTAPTLPSDYFAYGELFTTACTDKFCIAGGYYSTNFDSKTNGSHVRPVIVISQDNGTTWSYPESAYSNVPSVLWNASFKSVSCSNQVCIGSGDGFIDDDTPYKFHKIPFIAVSTDSGSHWIYPKSIYTTELPNNFHYGSLSTASCSENICIAAGNYTDDGVGSNYRTRPLLAQSQDGGMTWHYPKDIYLNLPSLYSNLGQFYASNCFNTLCIASGSYMDNASNTHPLLARSQDSGKTWSYPDIISSALPIDFKYGGLKTASCSDKVCIASGYYSQKNGYSYLPLLAMSQDGGTTWSYPKTVYSTALPKNFSYGDLSHDANCNGNICIATGYFYGEGKYRPLLIITQDGGKSWFYPSSIYSSASLPPFFTEAELITTSIKGQLCTASGHYYVGKMKRPLLAVSHDGGSTWSYPTSIYSSALPDNFIEGALDGAGEKNQH